ncbi:MAG TPA: peptidylprolyl isomerase [Longimicrobiales bacterium]|nr:peptidylprolyl isomerase [Longimicrobiales bacterium]
MGQTAQQGDTVTVHYTGKLDTGDVFDSSRERDPLEFTVGEGQVIPGFDRAVEGLAVGESREVRLEPNEAYGQPREDLVVDVPRSQFPPERTPEVGQQVQVQVAPDQNRVATIAEVGDEAIKLDLNHPLAGKPLTFEVELVEIAS